MKKLQAGWEELVSVALVVVVVVVVLEAPRRGVSLVRGRFREASVAQRAMVHSYFLDRKACQARYFLPKTVSRVFSLQREALLQMPVMTWRRPLAQHRHQEERIPRGLMQFPPNE